MALQRLRLSNPQFLNGSVAPVYTNPYGAKSYIKNVILHNTSTAIETANLFTVPAVNGFVAGAGTVHRWWSNAIQPQETVFIDIPYPIVLDGAYDTLQGSVNSTGGRVSIHVNGDRDQ